MTETQTKINDAYARLIELWGTRSQNMIDDTMSELESPIETLFFCSLMIASDEASDSVRLCLADNDRRARLLADHLNGPTRTGIEVQVEIDRYRVDFLVELTDWCPFHDSHHLKSTVIIECDGHDYHERTKEQARKDKSRDRQLQSLGYSVIRYTGSEIWTDSDKCARESLKILEADISRKFMDHERNSSDTVLAPFESLTAGIDAMTAPERSNPCAS